MSRDRRVTRKSLHIDALRGVAILAAAQYHYGSKSKLYERANLPALAQGVDSLGWVGVDLFFVLSAFLLTRNLPANRDAPDIVSAL
jgi:peptidoglycan/LPS O-acetylase OafA/YrhL